MPTMSRGAIRPGAPPPSVSHRIRSEFLEMPGLKLTLAQAQRLFGLDPVVCRALLRDLVEGGFLVRDSRDTYRLSAH